MPGRPCIRFVIIVLSLTSALPGCRQDPPPTPQQPAQRQDDDDPRDEPPPIIYGEDISEACPIDVDVHLPSAQDPAQPLVPEAQDEKEGAWTIRNDDMDAATDEIIRSRLQNGNDLNAAEGRPDLAEAGAIAGENDLVAVDVHNPSSLTNVYLNVYAMAAQTTARRVNTHANMQPANRTPRRLAIWRNPDRTGAVALPLAVPGPRDRVWIEGLGAGRYRFVLMYIQNGTPAQAAGVAASETGNPHGRVTQGAVVLTPAAGVAIACYDHARLSVAAVDIFQARREHVFDVLWGGRPVFDGRLWPGGGAWRWQQSPAFGGVWLQGAVHGEQVAPNGQAPGGFAVIVEAHGAFEPTVQAIGQRVTGSQRYEHRVRFEYQVEGVTLARDEPVTLMTPDHITFTPIGALAQGIGQAHWGTTYSFNLQARYDLFDQHDRKLVGAGALGAYRRQYGTQLQAYEALGMGVQAAEAGDDVRWEYVSPILPARAFTVTIGTKQRGKAIPSGGTLSSGDFTDSFGLSINNNQRGMLQQDIRDNNALASRTVFSVSQDVVVLLRNGAAEYDVRVARGQRLEILAPQQRPTPAAPWGGMGFRMTLGGAGGTQPDTRNPDRVRSNHNPQAP